MSLEPNTLPPGDKKAQEWHGRDVAPMLDISQTRLLQLAAEGIVPKARPAHYHVGATVIAYIRYLKGKTATTEAQPNSVGAAKVDLLQSRAALSRMELALKTGAVAKVSDFEAAWSRAVERMRQRLLSLPSKAAPLVAVEDDASACMDVIEELVHEALEELASVDVRVADGGPASGGGGTLPSDAESSTADEDDDLGVG